MKSSKRYRERREQIQINCMNKERQGWRDIERQTHTERERKKRWIFIYIYIYIKREREREAKKV